MSTADDWRFALSSPQAHVLTIVRAQLDGDQGTITELFTLHHRLAAAADRRRPAASAP